jgi:hypothetical protein
MLLLSAVRELGMFVGAVLLNLYENEVECLGPGPRRRGGAIVATAPPWARAGPLQWRNAETKTKSAYLLAGLLLIYRRMATIRSYELGS